MSYENPWMYKGKIFETSDIGNNFGFVYVLTDTENGKKYVGRKYFWSSKKISARKKVKSESDWKDYYGSSKLVTALIEQFGEHRFTREIISVHETKGQTNYHENKLQFTLDVLEAVDENGDRLFYNDNIMSRYFVPKNLHYEKTQEHKDKISRTLKELGIRPPTCDRVRTDEERQRASEQMKLTSCFVTNNPKSSNNILYQVETEQGLIEIRDLPKYCHEKGMSYINLREWSKRQKKLTFTGKVRKTPLHKKYKMKIISWKNEVTGESGVY